MSALEQVQQNSMLSIEAIDAKTDDDDIGPSDTDKMEMMPDQIIGESQFSCVLCDTCLTTAKQPKLLECLHAACISCISIKMAEQADMDIIGGVTCPKCEVVSDQDNLVNHHFVVDNETESDVVKKCVSCEDNAPATSYCVECKDFICASCVEAHRRVKITKDHTLKDKEEAEAESSANATNKIIFCNIHTNEQCTLFCQTCEKVTCRDCQLNEHRDHKYKFVSEMATEMRCNISALLKDVTYKRQLLKSATKVIDDRQSAICGLKTDITSEISEAGVQIIEAVKIRLRQLAERLNSACDAKTRALVEKQKTLTALSNVTDHCINVVAGILEKGTDFALLCSQKTITSHLQRIKARRADIPNPEIPVRIAVSFDKLPELLKLVNSIGVVMVDNKSLDDGSKSGALDQNQSPPPVSLSMTSPTYSTGNHNQFAATNGSSRHPSKSATPPLPSRMRVSLVHQYQAKHAPRNNSVLRSPIYGMNNMVMGVPCPPVTYASLGISMPHVTIRPTNPIQQVTSSTHPSADMTLRNIFPNNNAAYHHHVASPGFNRVYRASKQKILPQPTVAATGPYAQQIKNVMRNTAAPPPYPGSSVVMTQRSQPGAQWHSPQVSAARQPSNALYIDESFKIHLKTQNSDKPSVSSSVPKTPSPGTSNDSQTPLDKYCQETVKDLMATIAKLDSNGIEVIPEVGERLNTESMVDSSTESNHSTTKTTEQLKDDANEDWCAVCLDGGELICCDNCPKVFHINCHIPNLDTLPELNEVWQCMLCLDVANLIPPEEEVGKRKIGITWNERKRAERILLELYCQYENSLSFRDIPTDPSVLSKMPKIMTLDLIRQKLQLKNFYNYASIKAFVLDIRLIFKNAKNAYPKDSSVIQSAKQLEAVFERVLARWLPNAVDYVEGDSDDEASTEPKRAKKDAD